MGQLPSRWVAGILLLLLLSPAACLEDSSRSGSARFEDEEQFVEEAAVSSLPSGHTLVHLHFSLASRARRHYTLLPKAIGQLAAGVPFEEVELSLTQGRWHYHTWGSPLLPAKPSGAELRAAFHPRVPAPELPLLWGNLSHSLSGLFCASLNFLARPETTALQAIEFGPADGSSSSSSGGQSSSSGDGDGAASRRRVLQPRPAALNRLYAALPKEAVCTENLTPALKLLPCRDQAGVASLLLHRPTVFSADYNSLRVHIATDRAPQDGHLLAIRLSLSITLVLRPPAVPGVASAGARMAPKPRTYSSWRLGTLMGAELRGACPAATASRLMVQLPPQLVCGEGAAELLQPPPPAPSPAAGDGAAAAAGGEAGEEADAAAAPAAGEEEEAPADWYTQAFVLSPAPDGIVLGGSSGSSSSSGGGLGSPDGCAGGSPAPAFYWWDLQAAERAARRRERRRQAAGGSGSDSGSTEGTAAAAAAGPVRLNFGQEWRVHTVKGAAVASRPELSVTRYTTGRGFMHGGIVLRLSAVAPPVPSPTAAPAPAAAAAAAAFPANRTVCIFQSVPWYVRLWLHTLRLTVDGAPVDLDAAVSLRHVSPASDRAAPLVLDLCLDLPEGASEVTLAADYSKAFLHVFEWPPDAHRGFDVPAAVVTYPRGAGLLLGAASGGSGSSSEWVWRRSGQGDGRDTQQQQQLQQQQQEGEREGDGLPLASPLLAALTAAAGVEALHGDSLLVQLAPPDFSMPYNVVCLTSTVLAIYIGATLNALLRRQGKELRDATKGAAAARAAARQKAVKVLAVVSVFGGLALYVDEELRVQVARALVSAGVIGPDAFGGLGRPAPPGGH